MALTPWNRQEEWYQEMINASTGNYLPSITQQDAGKVMTVESDGSWGVENVPSELPTVQDADKGKYLHANDSTGNVEWADAPTELPSVTGSDEGKVLSVNNSGEWVAASPSSGSGGVYWVNGSYDADTHAWTLDKTAKELFDAASEQAVFLKMPDTDNDGVVTDDWYIVKLLTQFAKDNDGYWFEFTTGTYEFSASSDDEYPTTYAG